MKRHLETQHKNVYLKLVNEEDTKQKKLNLVNNKLQFQLRPTRSQTKYLLAKIIINDLQSYSLVEDEGFRNLINSLYPDYEIPSRKKMTQSIGSIQVEIRNIALENLKFISVTTDMWSSIKNESYVPITSHFFNEEHKLV
jgi:hypothetical protein